MRAVALIIIVGGAVVVYGRFNRNNPVAIVGYAVLAVGLGVPNQEEGQAISVYTGLREPWTAIWPSLRHLDWRSRRHVGDFARRPRA